SVARDSAPGTRSATYSRHGSTSVGANLELDFSLRVRFPVPPGSERNDVQRRALARVIPRLALCCQTGHCRRCCGVRMCARRKRSTDGLDASPAWVATKALALRYV